MYFEKLEIQKTVF